MSLPISPSIEPMLAKATDTVPVGDYAYEPKWDGFRCIVHRDGDDVVLGSRSGKTLERYFPDVVTAVLTAGLPERCVVDAEIVVPQGDRLDFDRLLDRVHPADSRVRRLAAETPASLVCFDLLAVGDESLLDLPFSQRRTRLEQVAEAVSPPVYITAITEDPATAQSWFDTFEGAGLDGVVAKGRAEPYTPGKRTMLKVKHHRTADVVVAGYRLHKRSTPDAVLLGSMLLGLYDEAGTLQFIGGCASFSDAVRAELPVVLDNVRADPADGHPWTPGGDTGDRRPGGQSRWSGKKDQSFVPLHPVLVVEIAYDQLQGGRLRHAGQFVRFRPDREASSCTYSQLEVPASYDLADVLR
jgi:ATP-dependent DNA ligase